MGRADPDLLLLHERFRSDGNGSALIVGLDTFPGHSCKGVRIWNVHVACRFQDGLRQRMFRTGLCNGCPVENLPLRLKTGRRWSEAEREILYRSLQWLPSRESPSPPHSSGDPIWCRSPSMSPRGPSEQSCPKDLLQVLMHHPELPHQGSC